MWAVRYVEIQRFRPSYGCTYCEAAEPAVAFQDIALCGAVDLFDIDLADRRVIEELGREVEPG